MRFLALVIIAVLVSSCAGHIHIGSNQRAESSLDPKPGILKRVNKHVWTFGDSPTELSFPVDFDANANGDFKNIEVRTYYDLADLLLSPIPFFQGRNVEIFYVEE